MSATGHHRVGGANVVFTDRGAGDGRPAKESPTRDAFAGGDDAAADGGDDDDFDVPSFLK